MYTKKELEKFIATYPINYYIHRDIPVIIDEKVDASSYDLYNNIITISMMQLNKANSEKAIRALFYHELAHAMYTPTSYSHQIKKAYSYIIKMIDNTANVETINHLANIAEDTRIETLASKAILDIDYESILIDINMSIEEFINSNSLALAYYIIRYQKIPADADNELITYAKDVSRYNLCTNSVYSNTVVAYQLYLKCCKYLNRRDDIDDEKKYNIKNIQNNIKNFHDINVLDIQNKAHQAIIENFAKKSKVFKDNCNIKQFSDLFEQAIINKGKINRYASATANYFGKLNKKYIGREDYKWFTQDGKGISVANKKIKLNLWLDESNSYKPNDDTTTAIVRALANLNEKIELTVINCGIGERIIKTSDKYRSYLHESTTGTEFQDDDAIEIIKKINAYSNNTVNIVIYDGYMHTKKSKLHVIDRSNFYLILDHENAYYFDIFKKAKVFETNDYTKNLVMQIIRILKQYA